MNKVAACILIFTQIRHEDPKISFFILIAHSRNKFLYFFSPSIPSSSIYLLSVKLQWKYEKLIIIPSFLSSMPRKIVKKLFSFLFCVFFFLSSLYFLGQKLSFTSCLYKWGKLYHSEKNAQLFPSSKNFNSLFNQTKLNSFMGAA